MEVLMLNYDKKRARTPQTNYVSQKEKKKTILHNLLLKKSKHNYLHSMEQTTNIIKLVDITIIFIPVKAMSRKV